MEEPICENCNMPAGECGCWDDSTNMYEVLAYRMRKGKIHLDVLTYVVR